MVTTAEGRFVRRRRPRVGHHGSKGARMTSSRKTGRRTGLTAARRYIGLALGALATAAIASSVAMAAGGTRVVSAASNSVLNQTVAGDTRGRTLYALHPEAARHLLWNTPASA